MLSPRFSLHTLFILLCLGTLLFSTPVQAIAANSLSAEEIAKMVGIFDPLKLNMEESSLELQVEIYRNENPVKREQIDPDLQVSPDQTIPIGSMVLHAEPDDEVFLAFALQRIRVRGEREYLIHWGLGRTGENSSGFGHSSYTITVPELISSDYNWSFGPTSAPEFKAEEFTPIYIFQGFRKDSQEVIFSGYNQDNVNYLAQIHNILLVITARN